MLFIDYKSPRMTYDSFKTILDLCFQRCEYFSLTHNRWLNTNDTLETELKPYLYSEMLTTSWFASYTTEANPLKRSIYPANYVVKAIIIKYYGGFFLESIQGKSRDWNQTVEDLCFFSNDELILGTVAHEYICRVYPPDKDFEAQILEIYGYWQTQDDDGAQIRLSDYIKTD
jgi:hypothetical protein